MADRKIEDNVWGFIHRAGELVGQMEEEWFGQDMQAEIIERGLQSPIEDMFWVACRVLCRSQFVEVNPNPDEARPDGKGGYDFDPGVFIAPQRQVGKYRVDFVLQQNRMGPRDIYGPVVVELDGHDFHDRDKAQRSYEKARDRFLVKEGYKVLHFTGSDVVADPFCCAYEALDMAGALVGSAFLEYNPADPTGRGT